MTGPKRVTEKQLAANRANAARSTGPRTAEGKAVSRWNALKHGVLAQAIIPPALEPYESRAEFEALLSTLREELSPGSAIEEMLVERIAVSYWRLGRVLRAEAGAIASRRDRAGQPDPLSELKRLSHPPKGTPRTLAEEIALLEWLKSDKVELRARLVADDPKWLDVSDEQVLQVVEDALIPLREQQAREQARQSQISEAELSLPAMHTAEALARYEVMVERQIHQSLATLERLQRLRGGEFVPPPVQLNVALDASPGPDLSS